MAMKKAEVLQSKRRLETHVKALKRMTLQEAQDLLKKEMPIYKPEQDDNEAEIKLVLLSVWIDMLFPDHKLR